MKAKASVILLRSIIDLSQELLSLYAEAGGNAEYAFDLHVSLDDLREIDDKLDRLLTVVADEYLGG